MKVAGLPAHLHGVNSVFVVAQDWVRMLVRFLILYPLIQNSQLIVGVCHSKHFQNDQSFVSGKLR